MASPAGSGRDVYPPMCLITATTTSAAPNETMPAAASENSSHWEAHRLWSWKMAQRARRPQTATSGAAASNTATRLEMMTQVSITAIATGRYPRGNGGTGSPP